MPTRIAGIAVWLLLSLPMSEALGGAWSQYGADAGRTGYTSEQPPAKLGLSWTFKPLSRIQPAWTEQNRQPFDHALHVAVDDKYVYFGSSADCMIHALDAATGVRRWAFHTDAPVRFAPALWKDRLFAVSDDGNLYCLSKEEGKLLWKKRPGPSGRMVLGNGRMMSKWPARGGPAVLGDVVYFGAGIWPSDGVFICALRAATGRPVWINDSSGNMVLDQPHGGARARSGVSTQGYLAVGKDVIFVPTGRAVPAAFDRASGKYKYFHLQKNGKTGGTPVSVIDGVMHRRNDVSASPEFIFMHSRGVLSAIDRANPKATKKSKKGRSSWNVKWTMKCPGGTSLISAGKTVFAGGKGVACAVDTDSRKLLWTQKLDGTALGLAFAGGRLLVSTDKGSIHCLAASGGTPKTVQRKPVANPYGEEKDSAAAAEEIIKQTGITKGYCLDLGCGDGRLAYELARRTKLHIYGIEKDPAKVTAARDKLTAAGLYGVRVTIHQGNPEKTNYPNYFANLVVSGNAVTGARGPVRELRRCLRPFGGTACIGKPGQMKKTVRGPLKGTGEWTHQYADPGNTACSTDPVKGPLTVLWFGSPDQVMPNRHGRGPAPLFAQGRLYIQGVNEIRALDAYNGHVIWEYPLKGISSPYLGDHLVGVAATGGNMCTDGKVLYVRTKNTCLRIDGETGKKLGELVAPTGSDGKAANWGYIACRKGIVFGSLVDKKHIVRWAYRRGKMEVQFSESVLLFAMDAVTGKLKWSRKADHSIRHNAIAVGLDKVFLIDRPAAKQDLIKPPPKGAAPCTAALPGKLLALDATTGKIKWTVEKDVFGTLLALSADHGVLLMSYQATRFKQKSEVGGRMAAFRAANGSLLWNIKAKYGTRPVVNGRTIYSQPYAFDLLTGAQRKGYVFKRSYGCGILAGGRNILLFRSATLGYRDLTTNKGTQNYGPIRPGCWINAVPAGGLVLVPDGSETCACSYLIKTSLALEPLK